MSSQLSFLLHVIAGSTALLGYWAAALLRKGSPAHRFAGRAYLLAMVVVIASAVPLILQQLAKGHANGAAFLGFLLVITATGVWSSWRAVRDKRDPLRYTGPVYQGLAVLNLLAGAGVLALGIAIAQPLFIGFSLVGVAAGIDMLRKRRQIVGQPLWWRKEHYTAMLGNGVATHIAFLIIGLPKLLPAVNGSALYYAAWFGPLLLATVAKLWLDRKYRVATRAAITTPNTVLVESRGPLVAGYEHGVEAAPGGR